MKTPSAQNTARLESLLTQKSKLRARERDLRAAINRADLLRNRQLSFALGAALLEMIHEPRVRPLLQEIEPSLTSPRVRELLADLLSSPAPVAADQGTPTTR